MICRIFGIYNRIYEKYEDAAQKTFDENFFGAEHIASLTAEAELSAENQQALVSFAKNADMDIKRFMWLFYYILFRSDEDFTTDIWQLEQWQLPSLCERENPGMMKACIYLAAAENLRRWLAERGLPNSFLSAFYDRYRYFVGLNLISHHTCGLCRLSPFLYAYGKPTALVIGRLSYQLREFPDYFEAYETLNGKRFFAALPWNTYDNNGLMVPNGKTPFYRKKDDILTAHTFDSLGRLTPDPVEINLSDYRKFLSPGDMTATVHIPGSGKLDHSSVLQSLADAKNLIGRYFPSVKAFVCKTWFIDPALRSVLGKGSNMLAFADMFDTISAEDNENHSLFEHIFNTVPCDLSTLVPKNDFQKKMLDRAKHGEKMHWGFGILKKEF